MHSRKSGAAAILAVLITLLLSIPVTAVAHHRDSHGKGNTASDHDGDADNDPGTSKNEDNDKDGVPNTPDPEGDADNRHLSGKDKHAEGGQSGNQGKSESKPDQDGRGPDRDNGGTDKPDGDGGTDVLDQDGNNGCGNDDDFDDDNEGLCLGRQGPPDVGGGGVTPADVGGGVTPTVVEGGEIPGVPDTTVFGGETNRPAPVPTVSGGSSTSPGVLAVTGLAGLPLLAVALLLLAMGGTLRRAGRQN